METHASFAVRVRDEQQGIVGEVSGRLVLGRAAERALWDAVMRKARGRRLRLDMLRVPQLDAAGIGMLVDLMREASRWGGSVSIDVARPREWRLLQLTGLAPHFMRDRVPSAGLGAAPFRGQSRSVSLAGKRRPAKAV